MTRFNRALRAWLYMSSTSAYVSTVPADTGLMHGPVSEFGFVKPLTRAERLEWDGV